LDAVLYSLQKTLAASGLLLALRRHCRLGRKLAITGVLLLALLAYGVPFDYVTKALEAQYGPVQPAALTDVQWVVVLGGGLRSGSGLPLSSRIGNSALYRITEGIRVHRELPLSRIVFSGATNIHGESVAQMSSDLAAALGVDRSRIVVAEGARTTDEEALCLRKLVEGQRFVLVTSAMHMPRAMRLFRRRGMDPIPAPTDHHTSSTLGDGWGRIIPSPGKVAAANAASHEVIGIAWAWLRPIIGADRFFSSDACSAR